MHIPPTLRIALALVVAAATLVVSRLAAYRPSLAAVWLWIAVFGLGSAIWIPGLTPYFLLPALIAGLLLLVATLSPGGWGGTVGQVAVLASALPMLLLWVGLAASGESVMGLKLHPLFTLPAAMGMTATVPFFARYSMSRGAWSASIGATLLASIGAAVYAGTLPAYSELAPQRLSITYVENHAAKRALWAIDAVAPVPVAMRAVAKFSSMPNRATLASWSPAYVAPAGPLRLTPPAARLVASRATDSGRRVTLALHGSDDADRMYLVIPQAAMIKAIDVKDWHFDAPPQWAKLDRVVFGCMSRDCASITITLTLGTRAPIALDLAEDRFGLPNFGGRILATRPKSAVPSQNGDGVILLDRLYLPGV